MARLYKETFSSESPNLGRINTNDTLRSLVTTGYGETPPTQYITTDGVNGPFTGQLWYSSNSQSYGLHVNSPDHAQDSIHPNSFTRNGVASRIANSYANLVKDHANSLYELGECVVIINSDPNHSANNTLYFINGTTGAESELVDVGQTSLSDGSVNESHLATGAVTTIKIQNGAVTGPKIASSAVDASKLASDSVTTSKVQNGAITNPKLADSSVSTNKIQNGAVTGSKIATNAVTSDKIPASAITEAKIGSGAVTSAKIPINELTGSKLVANTIGTREMNITGPMNNGDYLVSNGNGGLYSSNNITNDSTIPPTANPNWTTVIRELSNNTSDFFNINFDDFNYLRVRVEGIPDNIRFTMFVNELEFFSTNKSPLIGEPSRRFFRVNNELDFVFIKNCNVTPFPSSSILGNSNREYNKYNTYYFNNSDNRLAIYREHIVPDTIEVIPVGAFSPEYWQYGSRSGDPTYIFNGNNNTCNVQIFNGYTGANLTVSYR